MPKILIADDDDNISHLIADSLNDEGFETQIVSDGITAMAAATENDYDLILLDIMMPGADGLEVCRKLRDSVACPILFVTAKGRTIDTVLGLEIGADDYIKKPFVVEELVAKVKAHLRREKRGSIDNSSIYVVGNLKIIPDNFEVTKDGIPIYLTTREFKLLSYFCDNLGKVLTREQIFDAVWGMDYADIGSVTVTVKSLRDKLDPENQLIKTVWGVGYKLVRGGYNEH